MLVGQYQEHPNAVLTFTNPLCSHAGNMHTASCDITLYASAGGLVLMTHVAQLPVLEHMEDAAIIAMFQTQWSLHPQYDDMTPQN